METELIRAISNRLVIEFDYQGHHRIGEPHLLGDDAGQLAIELYQTAGTSRRGGLPQWRVTRLDEIENLVVTANQFTPRSDFNSNRSRWRSIKAKV